MEYVKDKTLNIKNKILYGISYFEKKEDRNEAIKILRKSFPLRTFRAMIIPASSYYIKWYWIAGEIDITNFDKEWNDMFSLCLKYNGDDKL